MINTTQKLDVLTSLRFFACIAILLHHSADDFSFIKNWIPSPKSLDVGVTFFFALSGFILTYVYRDINNKKDIYNFYVARFARLWPLHLTCIFLLILLLPERTNWSWTIAPVNLLLIQTWIPIPAYYFSYNAVTWSISAEVFFYALFPFLVINWKNTWFFKTCGIIGVSLAVVLIADRMGLPPYSAEKFLNATAHGVGYINPLSRMVAFFFGVVAGKFYLKNHTSLAKLSMPMFTFLELGILCMAYFVITLTSSELMVFLGLTNETALRIYLIHNIISIAFAMAIFVFAFGGGYLSKILAIRPLIILGEISFAIYMCHQIILRWYAVNREMFSVFNEFAVIVVFGIIIILSYLLWHFIEKPCREKLGKLLRKPDKKGGQNYPQASPRSFAKLDSTPP